ncbi:hypothetical protein [Burkholderia cepacia]|uniref:hypothetical protein n=1 Tax=Burkholderia cepacia TaxID=292 RepID=UPI000B28AB7B|nr:hypothetical protein [Burkholderia cepacia]
MGLSQRRRTIHIWRDRGANEWRVRYESFSILLGVVGIEWGFSTMEMAFDHARQVWEIWHPATKGETACSNG